MQRLRTLTSIGLSAALFAGCGGGALSPSTPSLTNTSILPTTGGSQTFNFTGAEQRFKVPARVNSVTITASGASGSDCPYTSSNCYPGFGASGNGGLVKATIPVKPGQTLYVYVGGQNGFNGGGVGGSSLNADANGGGESDVRQGGQDPKHRIIVAGGGGGGGNGLFSLGGTGGVGGAGGGKTGAAGTSGQGSGNGDGGGGGGGTQVAGGAAGSGGLCQFRCGSLERRDDVKRQCRECGGGNGDGGVAGAFFAGGDPGFFVGGPGGGGGGGWYGGGGAGSGAWYYDGPEYVDSPGGGGGGGSSFIEKGAAQIKNARGGAAHGDGKIIISW